MSNTHHTYIYNILDKLSDNLSDECHILWYEIVIKMPSGIC